MVALRHLPAWWWTVNDTDWWYVCVDTGQEKKLIMEKPDSNCCFDLIRNKWYPDTVSLAVDTKTYVQR